MVFRCAISGHFGGQKSIFDQPGSITRVWLLMSVNQTSLLLNSSIGICRASPSLGQAAAILVLSWLSCRVLIDAALTARGCDKRRVLASSNGRSQCCPCGRRRSCEARQTYSLHGRSLLNFCCDISSCVK